MKAQIFPKLNMNSGQALTLKTASDPLLSTMMFNMTNLNVLTEGLGDPGEPDPLTQALSHPDANNEVHQAIAVRNPILTLADTHKCMEWAAFP